MNENLELFVKEKCGEVGSDRSRLMDIVRDVQQEFGQVSGEAMLAIAKELNTHRVEVESVVSFYAFLSDKPQGKVTIRLCNGCIDKMQGAELVAKTFAEELGIEPGQTTADGKFTLEYAPCMGMCDQSPAALIGDQLIPWLSPEKAREIVAALKNHMDPGKLVTEVGDGNNANPLVNSMAVNNLRQKGEVLFGDRVAGAGLKAALGITPTEVIQSVKTARLRGRGGAGFPTGMKWEFTRAAEGQKRFVLCNADEGEPGTFKDRVLLTEKPDLLFEGMAIAGYAIGADEGVVYLRGEYAYLRPFLEETLKQMRDQNFLGNAICGKQDFNFDIRIQMGAGAYICGEETALISSCEGLRGDPKNRPPFPAQKGYQAKPTVVNNVETLSCVPRIFEKGTTWFANIGGIGSSGTKLLSVSGDCSKPGVYEVPFGLTAKDLLTMVGAEDTLAMQVGGASGQMIGKEGFDRKICFDDLATGGAVMIFNSSRDLLDVAENFMEFFIEESCGYCTPCRVGNVLLLQKLEQIRAGKAEASDLDYVKELGDAIIATSRCGLGQTSPKPILTSLENFRSIYEDKLKECEKGMIPAFDLGASVGQASKIAGRGPVHFDD